MTKTKKIISIVLSVIMLVSCFTFSTSALEAGKTVALKLTADKTTVSAGDTVTYSLYVDADSSTAFTNLVLYFSYNSNYFVAPKAANAHRTFLNDFAGAYKAASTVSAGSAAQHNNIKANMSAEELALYNAAFQIQCTLDTTMVTSTDGFTITDPTVPQMTFTMTVADNVPDGTSIPVAITTSGFLATSRGGYVTVANGTSTPSKLAIDTIDLSEASLNVSTGAAGPSVVKSAGQVKMTKTADGTGVEDEFQFRVVSKISKQDWDTYFANSTDKAADKNCIKKVGMVVYTGDTFSMDDAKATIDQFNVDDNVMKGQNGDYTYGATDYIRYNTTTGEATFGAQLLCKHSTLTKDPICVGFVKYLDNAGQVQTIYYAEPYTAPLKTSYDDIVKNYLAMPQA